MKKLFFSTFLFLFVIISCDKSSPKNPEKDRLQKFVDSAEYNKAHSEKPLTLAETIVLNIKENRTDWKYISGQSKANAILNDELSILRGFQVDTIVNRKCNIKIILGFGHDKVLLPDTFKLNENEAKMISTMFYMLVYQPMEKHRKDSIVNVRFKKEQLIINKMCK